MNIPLMEYYREMRGYTYEKVAELAETSIETVHKIFRGETEALDCRILQAVEELLRLDKDYESDKDPQPKKYPDMIRESQAAYCAKKEEESLPGEEYQHERACIAGCPQGYTLEDYYALPEEQRVELIDGVFYDMGAPTTGHQSASAQIFMQIRDYIDKKRGRCRAFYAPVDVQLDCDDKTMVQPDVLIVCDKEKILRRCIMGAPDFIVEILSESTKKKDMYLKLRKYEDAGVREYWMVDPERRRVMVCFFEKDDCPVIYSMKDKVPVGIYGGELAVDFVEVERELEEIGQ